jgi:hypothetical protein
LVWRSVVAKIRTSTVCPSTGLVSSVAATLRAIAIRASVFPLAFSGEIAELGSVLSVVAVASVGLAAVVGFASAALLSTGAGLAVTAAVFSSA